MLIQPFGFNATGKSVGRLVAIGQQFGGGSVGAVFGSYPNQYGIIIANEEISGSYAWADNGTINGTSAAVLTGTTNTTLILQVDPNAYPAKYCNDYTGSGYTDWVLPSTEDLLSIIQQGSNSLLAVPFGSNSAIEQTLYWTSHTYQFNTAEFVDFRTNEPSPYSGNTGLGFRCCGPSSPGPGLPFRPVRYFDYRT
jgi:hypothetical protein